MLREKIVREIELPQGIQAKLEGRILSFKGKKGEVVRQIFDPKMKIELSKEKITLTVLKPSKREKRTINTNRAHIRNMIKGADEGHTYKLKICSGHFPMTAAVSGKEFVVKNYLGEKIPRVVKIKEGATVKVTGADITVESTNLETAGQVAGDIEQLMRITNRDRRVFQDGIYIIEKDGKKI